MRDDPAGSLLTLRDREPRIVVGIIYPTGSIYITNKLPGTIANVPGNVVAGCLQDVSTTSQQLFPEEGRATIGTLEFTVVDAAGALTDELRDQLANSDRGAGRRPVRVYTGDTDDFTDGTWRQVETYAIDSVIEYDRGGYRFACSDIQRELREKIFVLAKTRLVADLSDSATEVVVDSTDGFEMLAHTAAFSDAPSSTVGYLFMKKTKEVIRYTGTDTGPNRFTGCTRGVFNTIPQAIDVDESAEVDRQPEVEEYTYLEMPVPEMLYAIQTGVIKSSSDTLPTNWHLGIAEASIEGDMFDQIGTDLYDPADPTAGFVLRFAGEKEQDGKSFCEEQLHVPMWTFSPITPEGKLGLRRLTRILADAPPSVVADDLTIISHGSLQHRVGDVINRIVIKWNWNGEDFTRRTELVNANSITRHGLGRTHTYELRGLTVQRHTVQTLKRLFNAISDRHGAPPQLLELDLSSTLNQAEIGDVARVVATRIRDYAAASYLDRSFEIQSRGMNWRTGALRTTTFASTASEEDQPPGAVVPLDDDWYSSGGATALNTVLTMSGDNVTANGNLPAGTYYHLGDFTINAGVTITVNGTVHLRIRGLPTNNGKIDGVGRGLAALTDPNTVSASYVAPTYSSSLPQYPQTFGSTQPSAGVHYIPPPSGPTYRTWAAPVRSGVGGTARPALEVIDGELYGLPAVLEGTPGMYGMPVVEGDSYTVRALGGDGGASGAGLSIVSRETLVFGGSGEIDLSGEDGSAPAGNVTLGGNELAPGAGAGGAPGRLLVLMDGTDQVIPDLAATFVAEIGDTPQTGNPITLAGNVQNPSPSPATPWTGYWPGIGGLDMWQSAHLATWIPTEIELGSSADEVVPAPTDLQVASADGSGVLLTWKSPPADRHDYVEIWQATTNDRTGAVLLTQRKANSLFVSNASSVTRYFWAIAVKEGEQQGLSEWEPVSETGGVSATFGGATGPAGEDAISFAISASAPLQFVQAANGGAWSHTTVDVTFTFFQGGSTIATHVIRFTRSGSNITGVTQSESGAATSETFVANGTERATVLVSHDDSGIGTGQTVTAVSGGDQGADGSDGEDFWTPNLVNVTRTGKSFQKTGGSDATWDASFYSSEIYSACAIQFSPAQNDAAVMVGLNSDPSADSNYTSIDYALYPDSGGHIDIYLGGTLARNDVASYVAGDVMAVTYDGRAVQFWKNSTLLYSRIASGLKLGADSSFGDIGAQVDNVSFTIGRPVNTLDPPSSDGLNIDPTFTDISRYWFSSSWSSAFPITISGYTTQVLLNEVGWSIANVTDGPAGVTSLQLSSDSNKDYWSEPIQIDPNDNYVISVWIRKTAGSPTGYLTVNFIDQNGDTIQGSGSGATGWDGTGTYFYHDLVGASIPSSWTKYTFTFGPGGEADATIPSGAIACQIGGLLNWNSSAGSVVQVQQHILREQIDLTTRVFGSLSSAFAAAGLVNTNISIDTDGSLIGAGGGAPVISSLTGSVATGQLTSNVLAALQAVIGNLSAIKADLGTITGGSLTLNDSGAFIKLGTAGAGSGIGFYVDYNSGTPRVFFGNASGNNIYWNGSTLSITGNLTFTNSTGSFAPTYTGFSTSPTGNWNYLDFGVFVVLWQGASGYAQGTSNSTAFTITNLPAAIRPAALTATSVPAVNSGVGCIAQCLIGTSGTITFSRFNPTATSWTASGNKAIQQGAIMVYGTP